MQQDELGVGRKKPGQAGWGGGGGHSACSTQLSTHSHRLERGEWQLTEFIKYKRYTTQPKLNLFVFIFRLAALCWLNVSAECMLRFNFTELPSLHWVRAVKGGKYLQ